MLPSPLATNTWIIFNEAESWHHDYRRDDVVLFMGWINNPKDGDDAVIMDDRGIRTIDLRVDEWEVYKR